MHEALSFFPPTRLFSTPCGERCASRAVLVTALSLWVGCCVVGAGNHRHLECAVEVRRVGCVSERRQTKRVGSLRKWSECTDR